MSHRFRIRILGLCFLVGSVLPLPYVFEDKGAAAMIPWLVFALIGTLMVGNSFAKAHLKAWPQILGMGALGYLAWKLVWGLEPSTWRLSLSSVSNAATEVFLTGFSLVACLMMFYTLATKRSMDSTEPVPARLTAGFMLVLAEISGICCALAPGPLGNRGVVVTTVAAGLAIMLVAAPVKGKLAAVTSFVGALAMAVLVCLAALSQNLLLWMMVVSDPTPVTTIAFGALLGVGFLISWLVAREENAARFALKKRR